MVNRARAACAANNAMNREVDGIFQGAASARLEAVASIFDVASATVANYAANEPVSRSRTYGDVVRNAGPALVNTARATQPSVSSAVRRVADAFDAGVAARGSRYCATRTYASPAPTTEFIDPEQVVVDYANHYLAGSASIGSEIDELSEKIALATGYPQETVNRYLKRNFVVVGSSVNQEVADSPTALDPITANTVNSLKSQGYNDVRTSQGGVPIVAYVDNRPVVAAFVLSPGSWSSTSARKHAKATALSLDSEIRTVWITDGNRNYYYDVASDAATTGIPAPGEPATGQ